MGSSINEIETGVGHVATELMKTVVEARAECFKLAVIPKNERQSPSGQTLKEIRQDIGLINDTEKPKAEQLRQAIKRKQELLGV